MEWGRTLWQMWLVSDLERWALGGVNQFFGGPAKGEVEAMPGMCDFYIPSKNSKGENGIAVPFSLLVQAMERFEKQLDILLVEGPTSHL